MVGKRKTPRHERDYYRTPEWVINGVLDELRDPLSWYHYIYDPHAGDGAILDVVRDRIGHEPAVLSPTIFGADIEPLRSGIMRADTISESAVFPGVTKVTAGPTLVACNPPYNRAREALRTIRKSMPHADLIALVPLALLGGIRSHDIWEDIGMPDWIRIVCPKPSFAPPSGPMFDVAWYGWEVAIKGSAIGRVERP